MGEVRNLKAVEGYPIFAQSQQSLAEALDGSLDIASPTTYVTTATTAVANLGLTITTGVSYRFTYAVLNLKSSGYASFPSTADIAAECLPSSGSSTANTNCTNKSMVVTLPVSSDPLVNARIVYRSADGGPYTTFYFRGILANNTDTTFYDSTAYTTDTAVTSPTVNTSGLRFFGNGQSLTSPINPITSDVWSWSTTAAGAATPNSVYKWLVVSSIIASSALETSAVIDSTARQFWASTTANQFCRLNFPLMCDSFIVSSSGYFSGYMLNKSKDMWPKSYAVTSGGVIPVSSSVPDEAYDRFYLMFANRSENTATTAVYLKRNGAEYAIFQVGKFQNSTGSPAISLPLTLVPGDMLKLVDASTSRVDVWGIKYKLR